MLNDLSYSTEPFVLPEIILKAVWHVDADASYRINHRMLEQGADFIAIRTLSGVGEMHLISGESFVLSQGTLLLLSKAYISHYHCRHDRWHFYWFEFQCDQTHQIPFSRVMEIPIALGEEGKLANCFNSLSASPGGRLAAFAQAQYLYILMDWLQKGAYSQKNDTIDADDLALLLAHGMRAGLSVSELAQQSCMCERSFRMLVKKHTGVSPKKYMLQLALETALIMLRTTDLPVAAIASDVGFANAFYFSRVFRNYFGIQPSKARWLHGEKLDAEKQDTRQALSAGRNPTDNAR